MDVPKTYPQSVHEASWPNAQTTLTSSSQCGGVAALLWTHLEGAHIPLTLSLSPRGNSSASCMNNIFPSVITQRSCPHVWMNCRLTCKQWASPSGGAFLHLQSADLSVNLYFAPFLHCSGATELLHLGQFLFDLERAIHPLPAGVFSFRGG